MQQLPSLLLLVLQHLLEPLDLGDVTLQLGPDVEQLPRLVPALHTQPLSLASLPGRFSPAPWSQSKLVAFCIS